MGPGNADSSVTWHDQPIASEVFRLGSMVPAQGIPWDIGHTHNACLQSLAVWGAPWIAVQAVSDSPFCLRNVLGDLSWQESPTAMQGNREELFPFISAGSSAWQCPGAPLMHPWEGSVFQSWTL